MVDINCDICHGFHKLTVTPQDTVTISDVLIDGYSIEEMIYLSWTDQDGVKCQPTTHITKGSIWILPLIYPLSNMISQVKNQITNGYFGQNLFESFEIFLPESTELQKSYPKIIQDYFKHDATFHIIKKPTNSWFGAENLLPYAKAEIEYRRDDLYLELMNNYDLLTLNDNHKYQTKIKNLHHLDDTWKLQYFIENDANVEADEIEHWKNRFLWDQNKWPLLYALLDNLDCDNITHAYLAELPPGSWIFPHSDSRKDRWNEHPNVARLYFPLKVNPRVYFKFAGFGLVDMSSAAWINNQRYVHGIVNDSDETRFIINVEMFKKNP